MSFQEPFPSEALLQQAVAGLLIRMPEISGVQILQGTQEFGYDIIFYIRGGFGESLLCACIVKNSKITGDVASHTSARTLLLQAEQAFNSVHTDDFGREISVERVYIITPFNIPPAAISSIRGRLRERAGQVVFIAGSTLYDLFRKHWPDYVLADNDESGEPILIAGITLKNIRCFESLELSFLANGDARKFILLFGDNGVGKTTLLRSIAIGLCDETIATSLMEMLPGALLRDKANQGLIKIDFISQDSHKKWSVETVIRRTRKGVVVIDQKSSSDFQRRRVFACGYGAGRLSFGTQDYNGYSLKNSLATLFNYETSLQNPELALRRIEAQQVKLSEIIHRIDAILMLPPGNTTLDNSGIRIRGPWGDFTPLGGLGDGFQATVAWIADLFGWSLFFAPDSILHGISGIVLIDELEQHLHPSWQREIIKLLHQQLPGIQFIGTSHAPMCALGTTALTESAAEIIRLRQGDGCVDATPLAIPKSQRADQVLTSPLFNLFSASSFDVSADIEHYAQLASKKDRSEAEEVQFEKLGERLESILSPFRSDLERRVDKAVRKAMEKELEEVLRSGRLTKKTLDFHIRHHIKNFLGQ